MAHPLTHTVPDANTKRLQFPHVDICHEYLATSIAILCIANQTKPLPMEMSCGIDLEPQTSSLAAV